MLRLGTVTFQTCDNGDYEDLDREEKIEFQKKWRMVSIQELNPLGKWILLPRED